MEVIKHSRILENHCVHNEDAESSAAFVALQNMLEQERDAQVWREQQEVLGRLEQDKLDENEKEWIRVRHLWRAEKRKERVDAARQRWRQEEEEEREKKRRRCREE